MNKKHQTQLVYEGQYLAEVDIFPIAPPEGWSPYLSLEDAQKLDEVREALRQGDIVTATKLARVFQVTPVPV